MRVLMFGWEYPPYSAGGLATATLSLASGLARLGADITLVVPIPTDETAHDGVHVVSAADVAPGLRKVRLDSPLVPYSTIPTVFAAASRRRPEPRSAYRWSILEDVAE